MQPSSERYDFKFKYMPDLCTEVEPVESKFNSIYHLLQKAAGFKKTVELIRRAHMEEYLSAQEMYSSGYTLFVTTDSNVPNAFASNSDAGTSREFIESYLLIGTADVPYLLRNGSSVYVTKNKANPVVIFVSDDNSIVINRIGKIIYSIPAANGIIHVLDNIAQVLYDT
jgi:hypothetical protein